jgi:hypothetical protein
MQGRAAALYELEKLLASTPAEVKKVFDEATKESRKP